jgi:hypothetical protein
MPPAPVPAECNFLLTYPVERKLYSGEPPTEMKALT